MKDELKKKMEELAEAAAVLCALSKNNPTIARINFKDGFEYCHDLMKKEHDAKVHKLVRQNRDLIIWLNRMSELRWEDSSHAPNFKYCVQELNKTLAEFES